MNKDKFKGVSYYSAEEVDEEIAILTQSRDFWKARAEELSKKVKQTKEWAKTLIIGNVKIAVNHQQNCIRLCLYVDIRYSAKTVI